MKERLDINAEKILEEAIEIAEGLACGYSNESGDAMSTYLSVLVTYLARLPKMEADAEYLMNYSKGDYGDTEAKKPKKDQLMATHFKEVMGREVAVYARVYKFIYRLNKNIIEIQKSVITQLSYLKSTMPRNINESELIKKIEGLTREVSALKKWKEEIL
ncbi:MAG: hypothetical protein M0P61_00240 [Ignavibacteriaceae bacterium]|nr:hypothetical protein [Ignavibacteriaceae bacterium]